MVKTDRIKGLFWGIAAGLSVGLAVGGCGQQGAANSRNAIEQSQDKTSPEAKADYLVKQAQAFLDQQKYQDAIKTSQYILANFDQQASAASAIIQEAKAGMTGTVHTKLDDVKTQAGETSENLKGKIGSFGQ